MRRFLFLPQLKRHEDVAYFLLRLLTGCFLVYGVCGGGEGTVHGKIPASRPAQNSRAGGR